MADRGTDKVIFANQLRGVAALLVLTNHFLGVYWRDRPTIAALTFSPPQTGAEPAAALLAAGPWHNTGPIGVALFFLISGFVIPLSMRHHTPASFLLARGIRIYSVYLVVLLIDLLLLALAALFWQRPLTLSAQGVLANALLVNNLGWIPSIDTVNWSLAVEMKFYILAVLIYFKILEDNTKILITLSGFILLLNLLSFRFVPNIFAPFHEFLQALASDLSYVIFMFIGVIIKFRHDGRLTGRRSLALALLLSATFVISMRLQAPDRASLFRLVINYGYALAIFTLAYRLRRRFRPQPLLDGLAAISYPLYLLHPLLGYSLLKILLMSAGMAFAPALALTAAAVTLTAWLVHRTIERPGIRLGHILGARYPLSFAASSRRST